MCNTFGTSTIGKKLLQASCYSRRPVNNIKALKKLKTDANQRKSPIAPNHRRSPIHRLHPYLMHRCNSEGKGSPAPLHHSPMNALSGHAYNSFDVQNRYVSAVDKEVACEVVARNALLVVVGKHPRFSVGVCLDSAFFYLLTNTDTCAQTLRDKQEKNA